MRYLKNRWYVAAWSDEVGDAPLARQICEQPILFFRDGNGTAAALLDRCPHRFAPLSYGDVREGDIQCRYHGLRFDRTGACTFNPHGPINPNAHVPSFPVVERDRAVWIWLGDRAEADPHDIPDLGFFDSIPDTAFSKGYLHCRANYLLLVDNILDLSHVDYLHPGSIGGGGANGKGTVSGHQAIVEKEGQNVTVTWINEDAVPSPIELQTKGLKAEDRFTRTTKVTWSPPGTMRLWTTTSGDVSTQFRNCHVMTPETGSTTHYFFASSRNFALDDMVLNDRISAARKRIFAEEDEWMCQGVQARMGGQEFMALKPALLSTDAASVRVRRTLERLLAAEAAS